MRRRIVSAMPPGARPWIRPETVTVIAGSCRIRASMRASSWTNGAVLAERDGRNSAGTIECRNCDGEAGAGRLGMTWPGIHRIRITPCGKLVQQFRQGAFERIVGVEMCGSVTCCLVGSTATRPHTRSAPASSNLNSARPNRPGRWYRHPLSRTYVGDLASWAASSMASRRALPALAAIAANVWTRTCRR